MTREQRDELTSEEAIKLIKGFETQCYRYAHSDRAVNRNWVAAWKRLFTELTGIPPTDSDFESADLPETPKFAPLRKVIFAPHCDPPIDGFDLELECGHSERRYNVGRSQIPKRVRCQKCI